jgi:flagellar hook-associated protein 1 FlgK
MADLLSTAVSGLRAFQRALDVTGHNIANASTPGYSRQRVELASRAPDSFGKLSVGTGVDVTSVRRNYDQLLTTQMRSASSTMSRLSSFADKAEVLNRLFADAGTGLSTTVQRFANALQAVASDPSSTAARQLLLSEAGALQQRLSSYDQRLTDLDADLNGRIAGEIDQINTATQGIARLNLQIVSAQAAGQSPNDLLDTRDKLINEISEKLSVTVVPQDDGALNIFSGKGTALVLGGNAGTLAALRNNFDPERFEIALQSGSGSVDITSTISGGSLGGILDFRREMLEPVRNDLGLVAVGIASLTNAQHREGMDLYGNLGGDFFATGPVEVLPGGSNSGSATIAVTRSDVGSLSGADYLVQFDGTAWTARDATTGVAVPLTGAGSAANPYSGAGLSFVIVGGTPTTGDQFLVRPTARVIDGFRSLVTDPSRVAAAAPIRTAAASSNTGTGVISAGEVLDAGNAQLRASATITFLTATTYSVNGAGSFTYAPGASIDANGWRVAINGVPATGDSFTVSNNSGGVSDNRNMLAMAETLGRGVFAGGTESVNGAVSRLVGEVGVATGLARTSAEAQELILEDVRSSVDAVSGVNLDEEAANMLRYQQAYQAAAQVIRITQEMFDTLINATGR